MLKKEKSVGFIKRHGFVCEITGICQVCWEHNCGSITRDVSLCSIYKLYLETTSSDRALHWIDHVWINHCIFWCPFLHAVDLNKNELIWLWPRALEWSEIKFYSRDGQHPLISSLASNSHISWCVMWK